MLIFEIMVNCCDYLHPIGNYKVLDGWFYGTLYYLYVIFFPWLLPFLEVYDKVEVSLETRVQSKRNKHLLGFRVKGHIEVRAKQNTKK